MKEQMPQWYMTVAVLYYFSTNLCINSSKHGRHGNDTCTYHILRFCHPYWNSVQEHNGKLNKERHRGSVVTA